MRTILSMPNDGQSSNYLINALQDRGHELVIMDHRSYPQQCAEQLPQIMKAFKPDLFLCLHLANDQTYPPEYIENLKSVFPEVQYVAWIFDITINGKYAYKSNEFLRLVKTYDYFFTVAKSDVDKFQDAGIPGTYWVPEGYCNYSHVLPAMNSNIIRDTKSDVLFVGQFGHKDVHEERMDYLDAIASIGVDLRILGQAFNMTKKVQACYVGRPTHNDIEHCREVVNTKINFCHSGWKDVDSYVSARNYRVSAAGGFMLCNDGKGVRDLWEVDKEVVVYSNIKECLDKVRYYLEHEDERLEIADAGRQKTLTNYSFDKSIEKIEGIVD